MRKIVITEKNDRILLKDVNEEEPIFAIKKGASSFCGMVVHEEGRWILRIGGSGGATGFHSTLKKCLVSCLIHDYEFFIY